MKWLLLIAVFGAVLWYLNRDTISSLKFCVQNRANLEKLNNAASPIIQVLGL